ncbi:MAG: O-antigen ligase family protein [Tumebacillaceae bacterium]
MQRQRGLRLPQLRGMLDVKGFVFAGFLSAGYFKADPRFAWLPIDLTVLFAALTIVCIFWELLKNGGKVHKNLIWMMWLFVLFAVPIFWTQWNAYATEKVQRFYTLTMIAAVAPFFLIKTKDDLRRFLSALTLLGIILSSNAAVELVTSGGNIDRLTSFGSNTIALGRGAGMAFVWIAVLALDRRIGAFVGIGSLGFLGVVMLASGSRGPLLAAMIGLFLLCIFYYWRNRKTAMRFLGVLLLVGTMFGYGLTLAPPQSIDRITGAFQGKVDTSAQDRIDAYNLSWDKIQVSPQGLGWGGFASKINFWDGEGRQYPHNIVIEVFLEEGWLAGLLFLGMLVKVVPHSLFNSSSPETRALFAMLLFFVVNALVSGDLNDNKELFAFLALSLRYRSETRGLVQSGASDLRSSAI